MNRIDHKELIAGLPAETRARLLAQSDGPGLTRFCAHFGAVLLGAVLIVRGVPGWPLLLVVQGLFIGFLFTPLHETIHRTAFRTEWLNTAVAALCGFAVLIAPNWFRYFHFAHHRFTHEPGRDPELEAGKPQTLGAYLLYVSGGPVWAGNVRVLISNALGRRDDPYVPARARAKVVREARLFLCAYGAVLIASLVLQSAALFWVWVLPALLGQPFMRLYLLAEHTRCPHVANMLENTRTTFTNRFVRFIAWNMPYHIEHHAYPAVPFHKLPAFHQVIKDELKCTQDGYARFHKDYVGAISDGSLQLKDQA
ncbi:MAG: fatty acid desaturase family protein [Pseudomonadota bacterium]